MGYGFCIRVQGSRALFTRPETKVERYSYSVITPSAAKGILEAVYWHPGMKYVIDKVTVLSPIRFDSIKRNEIVSVAYASKIKNVAKSGDNYQLNINDGERQQRSTVYLKDVDYLIDAHFEMDPHAISSGDTPAKFYNILLRRLRNGQNYYQPYMGCREFPANVSLVEGERPEGVYKHLNEMDLGFMLHSIIYEENNVHPVFFHAVMRNGEIIPEVKQ